MIEQKDTEINGEKYSVTQFAARRGLKLKTRLVKLIAPIAALAVGANKEGGSIMDMQLDAMSVSALVDNLDSDNVVNLILELMTSTRRNGSEITPTHFDEVYSGNYGELYRALRYVIEVNFGSFFKELGIGNRAQQPSIQPSLEITASKA